MLDPPGLVASAARKTKSSNVTPCVNPVTFSAYWLGGATVVFSVALYVHVPGDVVQSKPPKTLTASRAAFTTRFSTKLPALAHA
jgi:hypothetical protein